MSPSTTDEVRKYVLEIARYIYGPETSDAQLLRFNPTQYANFDASEFYDLLAEMFELDTIGSQDELAGSIENTIEVIAANWDGYSMSEVALPPEDYLESYVHGIAC